MPRTVVKEAGWGGYQCFPECSFAMTMEDKAYVFPRPEHHDLAEKTRCIFKRCLSRLPPANAASDGCRPLRMSFSCRCILHNYASIASQAKVSKSIRWRGEFVPKPCGAYIPVSLRKSFIMPRFARCRAAPGAIADHHDGPPHQTKNRDLTGQRDAGRHRRTRSRLKTCSGRVENVGAGFILA